MKTQILCPDCHATDVSVTLEYDGTDVWQEVICRACGHGYIETRDNWGVEVRIDMQDLGREMDSYYRSLGV